VLALIGVALCFGSFVAGRAIARRLLGLDGVHLLSTAAEDAYFAAPAARRAAWRLSGPIAVGAAAVVLSFVGLRAGGATTATTRVSVQPDGPAAAAGMQTGDRIVAIAGTAVADWPAVQASVAAAGPGGHLPIVVQRDAAQVTLDVTTSARGRIGVAALNDVVPVPTSRALVRAIAAPLSVPAQSARATWADLTATHELGGPIGIVRETAGATGSARRLVAAALAALGAAVAMTWPVSLLLALVLAPRRRDAAPARAAAP
jgi:membrane-associated protease RseP (regulator of RpoE activity)